MQCCPADSAPYLESSYVPLGKEITVSGVEFYEINPSSTAHSAVIVFPDWYGWNAGHTRAIADLISNLGFHVIVPRLLSPGIDGNSTIIHEISLVKYN